MRLVREGTLFTALTAMLLAAVQVSAQEQLGTVTGRVIDATTQQPISGASVMIEGTQRGTLTRPDGAFLLTGVAAGTHQLRASQIGYGSETVEATVIGGATANVQFALAPQAVQIAEVVATGYGTQRREAITGSVATVNADQANVGVVTTANDMLQGRVSGVHMTLNDGEPGAGAQIRIRGGTSISASNEPLYVIDGVPIDNVPTEARGIGIDTDPPLARSPLTLLNPADIESISVLKDASSTAIYGSRAANGVILIQTKRGHAGRTIVEYDGYAAVSTPARRLDLLSGNEYRAFVQRLVEVEGEERLRPRLESMGTANTDWEREVTRNAITHNHNLSFSGGSEATQYRASLNYMNQEGVVIQNGLERIQGRLNATHQTLENRLRLGLALTASHVINDYLPFENFGGFEGAVFTNMVIFDPTRPITVVDEAGQTRFFEEGTGRQEKRNPVAMAHQIDDIGSSTRTLGNVSAALDLLPGLTGQLTLGADHSDGVRRTYIPRVSPVTQGAQDGGTARQVSRNNTAITLQSYLTLNRRLGQAHGIDVVGGYEFAEYSSGEFGAESRGFVTDAFGFHNLGAGSDNRPPFSWREDHRLVSFFSRANYNFADRYYVTGVLRYDGSSRFGEGNKWSLFPAISASWRISEEAFMADRLFSDLRLRVGYGLQGNPGVSPYASLITLDPRGHYIFGESGVIGIAPNRNPNPDLKWEQTAQFNVALDFGLANNRYTGTLEYYRKNTSDLLLEVPVPQPALVTTRLENVGRIRNQGVEASLDALVVTRPDLRWSAGLVFSADRSEVVDLAGRTFLPTARASGQGQSDTNVQRLIPGEAIGTFWGPEFVRVERDQSSPDFGKQLFRCDRDGGGCVNGLTTSPTGDDYRTIGNASPDFTLGLRSNADWRNFDFSFLVRSEIGRDVFNNTALVYETTGAVLQGRNFLRSALNSGQGLDEPAIFSSRWVEDGSFVRLQNVTLGYTFAAPGFAPQLQGARVYVSGDNLLLLTDYSGYDPEVHTAAIGLAVRGVDYLTYPRSRTFTTGIRFSF